MKDKTIRRTACACTKCNRQCDGFVHYDKLEWAKALRLFNINPLVGGTGEFRRPYKLCSMCSYGACQR